MPETVDKRPVSFGSLREAAPLIAKQSDVDMLSERIEGLFGSIDLEFATTEEVLALFTKTSAKGG